MTKTNLIMPVEPDFLQSMHVVPDRTTSRIAEQEHLPGLPVLWHEVIQVEWLVKDDAGVEQATWQKFRIANLMKKLMHRKLTRETWKVYFHLCRLFRKIQRAEHSDRATRIISKESKNQDRRLRKLEKEFDALRFQFTCDAEGL